MLGRKFNTNGRFTMDLIFGYLIYSLIQMIGAAVVQLFKLDYSVYKIYMILFMIICLYYIHKDLKCLFEKGNLKQQIKKHLSNYYLLYLISFGLLCMALLMTNYMWVGNHQDDGWYLMKVAQAPYLGNQYDISYATGFQSELGLARCFNTFELDYAFWSNFLGIYPSVFCKFAMAYFNYFLTLCGFTELFYVLKKEKQINNIYLYFLLTIFIFALPSETLANHHLLTQQDGWHFSTAIWYGSGIVQSVGSLLLFIPLMNSEKFDLKSIMLFCVSSLVLMSKASQSFPIILLSGILYLVCFIWHYVKERKVALGLIASVCFILLLIPGITSSFSEIQLYMQNAIKTYVTSPLIIGSCLVLILTTYMMRNQNKIIMWSSILLAFHVLIFVPGFQRLFLNTAIYTFVAGRTVTTLGFMTVMSAGIYLGILLSQYQMKTIWLKALYLVGCMGVISVFLISHNTNIGLKNTLFLLIENPRLIPESTIELSETLSELANDSELVVLSESWVTCSHNHAHAMATSLRIEATNIKVITAVHRFSEMSDDINYKDFDLDKQMIYEDFVKHCHVKEKVENMRKLLEDFPVDVIVTRSKDAVSSLEENLGFKVIREVSTENEIFTYYVLEKE